MKELKKEFIEKHLLELNISNDLVSFRLANCYDRYCKCSKGDLKMFPKYDGEVFSVGFRGEGYDGTDLIEFCRKTVINNLEMSDTMNYVGGVIEIIDRYPCEKFDIFG